MPFADKRKYRDYMAEYMREYRKRERQAIKEARRLLGMNTRVRKTQKRKKPQKKRRK